MSNPIGALSMPAIATPSLPPPVQSSGTSLLQAIGQAPQLIQDAQLKTAATQDQLQGFAEKRLQQLAALGSSNPAITQNPQWRNQVEQTYRQLNQPVPKDEQGNINIQAMLPPLPPDIALKGLGLPPGVGRKALFAGYSYDPEILNAPMQTALNSAAYTGAQRMAQSDLLQFQSGKLTPEAYQASINSLAATLGDSIQSYLDPSIVQAGVSQWADLELQKLHELGIVHPQNEDKYRQDYLNFGMQKFTQTFGEKVRVDDANIARAEAVTAKDNQQRIFAADMQSKKVDLLNAQVEHLQQINQVGAVGGKVPPVVTQFLTQYRSLQNQYDANIRAIGQQGVTAASKPIAPGQPSLVDATVSLKQKLDAMSPTYTQLQSNVNSAAANAAKAVTGQHVQPVDHTKIGVKGEAVPGSAGYKFTGEKRGDVYVVIGPDGKPTGWKP